MTISLTMRKFSYASEYYRHIRMTVVPTRKKVMELLTIKKELHEFMNELERMNTPIKNKL